MTCGRGCESYLVAELAALGLGSQVTPAFRGAFINDLPRGVSLMEAIFKVNYQSHLAMRVLLPLRSFEVREKMDLYEQIKSVDWRPYIPAGRTFAIVAKVDHPHFTNTHYAAQLCKDAIVDQYRERSVERPDVNAQNPDVQVQVFVHEGQGTVNMDTSVLPLHMRGYRRESVEAPMRETLAAHMLHMAGIPQHFRFFNEAEAKESLVLSDPMCGSGTILAEAALMATQTPAAFLREKWGFTHLPDFSKKAWDDFKREQFLKRRPLSKRIVISGTDIDPKAAQAASQTLRRLGFNVVENESQMHKTTREDVLGDVLIRREDFRQWAPASPELRPTVVMTNAPYGQRIGGEATNLRPLYRSLGDFMKQKTRKPATGWVLTGDLQLSREVGLQAKRRHILYNGGIECRLLEYDLF